MYTTSLITTTSVVFTLLSLSDTNAQLTLGQLTLSYERAESLVEPQSEHKQFLQLVGGVSFAASTSGDNSSRIVSIQYADEAPDGSRLRVKIILGDTREVEVCPQIYDWELVPITKFVEQGGESCVTLLGRLKDKKAESRHIQAGHKIINYHPAFENTLLGLRLLQGDLLILTEDACDLPRFDGNYILGAGEVDPNIEQNKRMLRKFRRELEEGDDEFDSYVIWDRGISTGLTLDGSPFPFYGNPFWHCWAKELDGNLMLEIFGLREELRQKLSAPQLQKEPAQSLDVLKEEYRDKMDRLIDAAPIKVLKELSERVTRSVEQASGINPAVYRSLRVTMCIAALLRHVKGTDESAFADFHRSVQAVRLESVTTPTILPRWSERLKSVQRKEGAK